MKQVTAASPLGKPMNRSTYPAYGISATTRPITPVTGVSVGSAPGFASPFVSSQVPSERETSRVIRWVNTVPAPDPVRRLTMSPTRRPAAGTTSVTTAAPSGMVGSIDEPPTTSVW